MKCFTARWVTTLAAAVWLGLPAVGLAQTAPPTAAPAAASSVTQQPPAASAPAGQPGAAQEHLRQAQAALNDIPAASLAGGVKTRMTELKRHLNALEKSAAGSASTTASKTTARAKSNWATEVAAIDKILTELLGPATGASGPPPTLDETAKTKLTEVRTQITAFASAMSGTANPAPEPSSPSPAAASGAMAKPPDTSAQPPAPTAAAPTPAAPTPAAPTAAAPPTSAEQTPPPAAQGDPEAAKRHLTTARDTLSQLTQLPAAAQLTGEPRTQVSQLITNFNALITATSEWRAAYDKVNANLTALIGAQSAEETPAPAAGVAGAVGTSGAMAGSLDPAIKAKLAEFRNHLVQFEKAAGGASADTSASKPPTATPAATTSATPETTTPEASAAPPTQATATPAAATSSTPGAVGTSGAAGGGAAAQERPAQQKPATAPPSETASQDSPMSHIDAIEAILSGRSAATSTPGATATAGASAAASITLDRAQLEQIRMHLAELRKIVEKK